MRSQGYETAWSPPPGLGPSRITHRLLSLALVGLDLQLQLVHQVLQPQQVLPVFLRLGADGWRRPVWGKEQEQRNIPVRKKLIDET